MIDILLTQEKALGSYYTFNPPHKHENWELVIFEKGTAKNYVNNVPYDAEVGTVFLLGPMHLHAIKLTSPQHLHIDIYAKNSELEAILQHFPEDFRNDVLSGKICIQLKLDPQEFASIIKNIHNVEKLLLIQQTDGENSIQLKPLTLSILQYVLSLYLSERYMQKNIYPEWLLTFLRRLSSPENFSKSVNELIAETNYSHTQFSKLFKKFCDCSLIEYLKNLRLSYASTLLTQTDYSTLYICEACGYDSYSYFERIFKEKFKCSPQQYRKMR